MSDNYEHYDNPLLTRYASAQMSRIWAEAYRVRSGLS